MEIKIRLLANKSLLLDEPRYIKNLSQPVLISSLRSSTSNRLVEPFMSRQIITERSFCHCAPRLYSQLPFELRTIDILSTLKKKPFFFEKAYDLENLVVKYDYKV